MVRSTAIVMVIERMVHRFQRLAPLRRERAVRVLITSMMVLPKMIVFSLRTLMCERNVGAAYEIVSWK